jgi:hypothetical protein
VLTLNKLAEKNNEQYSGSYQVTTTGPKSLWPPIKLPWAQLCMRSAAADTAMPLSSDNRIDPALQLISQIGYSLVCGYTRYHGHRWRSASSTRRGEQILRR